MPDPKRQARGQTATAVGEAVATGVVEAVDPEVAAFAEVLAQSSLDSKLWTGAFAKNVWGGRYAVDGLLGQGGQGSTFVGTDLQSGARVAIKVFDLKRAKDWKSVQLFEREVETLKQLNHPAIPRFLDVIADDDTGARGLVMTLVPGTTLAERVKTQGPLHEAALWSLLVDAADVLAALHGNKSPIIHRDIKPQNIVLRPDGKHCLVDFGGVGRTRGEAGSTVVGTFGYMAPEQLYGRQTPATDLYALGASALMLATGVEPEELPRKGLALDVDKAAPQLSPPLRALLSRLVSPEPEKRPVDARALLAELKGIAQQKHKPLDPLHPEDHRVDARWPDGWSDRWHDDRITRRDADEGLQAVQGVLTLIIGVIGMAGATALGMVLLPVLLSIIGVFLKPADRQRLEAFKVRVDEAARVAQRGFRSAAHKGAQDLNAVSERDRQRQQNRHLERRLQREAEKQRRREEKNRRKRRDDGFWR